MNNCYITTNDCLALMLYDKQEVLEIFGQEFLDEYGHELPEELIKAYKDNKAVSEEIQNKLRPIYKNKD